MWSSRILMTSRSSSNGSPRRRPATRSWLSSSSQGLCAVGIQGSGNTGVCAWSLDRGLCVESRRARDMGFRRGSNMGI